METSDSVELKHKDITDKILFAFSKSVFPQVGYGFLEKVYENSMFIALQSSQLLNYLRATPYKVGLLLNFGPKPEFVRRVFDNQRKPSPGNKY